MSLPNLPKVQAFQATLPDQANGSLSFRFYSPYDKVCRADTDLSGDFDSIPHAELMTSVARRVSDSALLSTIGGWPPWKRQNVAAERNERPAIGMRVEARRRACHSRRCCPSL